MRALTLRSLASRKLRTALTGLAIVLGVAMISASFVLTDTLARSFDRIFEAGYSGIDVTVSARPTGDLEADPTGGAATLSTDLVERVAAVDGVDVAEGTVQGPVSIRDKRGKATGQAGFSFATGVGDPRLNPFRFSEGRSPVARNEVALDAKTSDDAGFVLGDRVVVVGERGKRTYRLVGVARFGDVDSLAGAGFALLSRAEAADVVDKVGRADEIAVVVDAGVRPEIARDRIVGALRGERVRVETGRESASRQSDDLREQLGFLQTALLIFGGIAVFVGAFVIYNTFSITLAQRTRELALLRMLGASSRQVLRSVMGEALIIGLAASTLGIAVGLVLAPALAALFGSLGLDLPQDGTVLKLRTVLVALVVGTLVALIASVVPARRAMRVAPIIALREGLVADGRSRPLWKRVGLLGIYLAITVAAVSGASGGTPAWETVAAAVVFVVVLVVLPSVVGPLSVAVGWPLEKVFGLSGRLARENAARSPSRTAVTASALMIGVAVVTFVTIFAAGLKGSINASVDRSFAGDLTVVSEGGFAPVPAGVQRRLAELSGVSSSAAVRFSEARVRGQASKIDVIAVDPEITDAYAPEWSQGGQATLTALGRDGVVVDEKTAVGKGRKVGDRLSLLTPTGARVTLTVRGIIREGTFGLLGGGVVISTELARASFGVTAPFFVAVAFASTAPASTRTVVERELTKEFPNVKVQDREEFKADRSDQIGQLLGLVYVLLALSVIVSLLGILNTLALSVFERAREIGMLRAIGASRRLISATVRLEAVITSMIGAILGAGLGVLFAVLISRTLEADGFVLAIPVVTLITLVMLSAGFGVLASIGPARRAGKTNILDAVAHE